MTERYCPACNPFDFFGNDGKAGLLWIGRQFYKTPEDFVREGAELGVSRRIQSIPHGFKVGETWIFVAHVDAVERLDKNGEGELFDAEMKKFPGIFAAFKPTRIERIVKQSEFDLFARVGKMIDSGEMGDATVDEVLTEDDAAIFKRLDSDVKRGITLIPVPDDDPDHNRKGK